MPASTHSDVWEDVGTLDDDAGQLQREWDSRREEFWNQGYREGVDAGKQETAQAGFDEGEWPACHAARLVTTPRRSQPRVSTAAGFRIGAAAGLKWGTACGIAAALRGELGGASGAADSLHQRLTERRPHAVAEALCEAAGNPGEALGGQDREALLLLLQEADRLLSGCGRAPEPPGMQGAAPRDSDT